jgi:hypothetical protein
VAKTVTCIRRQDLAAVVATAAVAFAAPASGASAQTTPPAGSGVPVTGGALPGVPVGGGAAVGGSQIGAAGCTGGNRPSGGGNNGSASTHTCATLLSFSGPQIGQIASVIGPTLIGSPLTTVAVTAGSVQY